MKKLRILFVDDDEDVLRAVKGLLECLGHEAILAKSGKEALHLVERNRAGFDLVITDYQMPGFTGAELARGVKIFRPDMPIVIITGGNEEMIRQIQQKIPGIPVTSKTTAFGDLQALITKAVNR